MARYEGMEDLLQRVREQLQVEELTSTSSPLSIQQKEQRYEDALEAILLVLRDAEQARASLHVSYIQVMTEEQQDDLGRLLAKALQTVSDCQTALQQTVQRHGKESSSRTLGG